MHKLLRSLAPDVGAQVDAITRAAHSVVSKDGSRKRPLWARTSCVQPCSWDQATCSAISMTTQKLPRCKEKSPTATAGELVGLN